MFIKIDKYKGIPTFYTRISLQCIGLLYNAKFLAVIYFKD